MSLHLVNGAGLWTDVKAVSAFWRQVSLSDHRRSFWVGLVVPKSVC